MALHDDFEAARKALETLQSQSAEAAQAFGRTKDDVVSVQLVWEQMEKAAPTNSAVASVVASGSANIAAMASSFQGMLYASDTTAKAAMSAAVSGAFLTTNTVMAVIGLPTETRAVITFDPETVKLPTYEARNYLSDRLGVLDQTLKQVCQGVWEALYGAPSDPGRAALFAMRQAYDQLFTVLAPDDRVRASSYWKRISADKPLLVTRNQRIDYALAMHVSDKFDALELSAATKATLDAYHELNAAHKREPLDPIKTKATLRTMYAWLELWADALGL
ncbi:MAG TPA: hypothetical protein VGM73_15520 [Candidatus Didemnitutus sp.]|jgi:hypothetical protein